MLAKDKLIIKAHTRRIVKLCGGGKAAAAIADTSATMISNYCDDDRPQCISVPVFVSLAQHTGDESFINYIVKLLGLSNEKRENEQLSNIMVKFANVAKEGADFTAVTTQALADNKITPNEARSMRKEALELIAALDDMIGSVSNPRGVETTETTESP